MKDTTTVKELLEGKSGDFDYGIWHPFNFAEPEARSWSKAGFLPESAITWRGAGWRPGDAKEWHQRSFTVRHAKCWLQEGFTPKEASAWASQDVELKQAIKYRRFGKKPSNLFESRSINDYVNSWDKKEALDKDAEWIKAGLGEGIEDWKATGMNPHTASWWKNNHFLAEDAKKWSTHFIPDNAFAWRREGFTFNEAKSWDEAGFAPSDAKEWYSAGISPSKAKECWENGIYSVNDVKEG